MTVGQLSFYDYVKQLLLRSGYFGDNSTTHFLSSLTAVSIVIFKTQLFWFFYEINLQGAVATTLTQPLDVLKTRAMNAKPGEFSVCNFNFVSWSKILLIYTCKFFRVPLI